MKLNIKKKPWFNNNRKNLESLCSYDMTRILDTKIFYHHLMIDRNKDQHYYSYTVSDIEDYDSQETKTFDRDIEDIVDSNLNIFDTPDFVGRVYLTQTLDLYQSYFIFYATKCDIMPNEFY